MPRNAGSNSQRFKYELSGAISVVTALATAPAWGATLIQNDSLLISSTTYEDVGAVAGLTAGTSTLPGSSAGKTSTAVAGGSYTTVFNNESADPAFGVSSAIKLQDINITTSPGKVNGSLTIDPNVVSTSFSSKSELSLNIAQTSKGLTATFMGYAGGGVGKLDVSNSDTTAYKDTTNPVTSFFAPSSNQTYAFNRSVVAVNADGTYSATQSLAYGGNNGRSAVLGPNGLYYTVGNSNNGSGTPTQLTKSTGLEVVIPGSTPNSTMINSGYQSISGDKAGKDTNFRGLTLYDGSLYFTKGSGSNGIDTVYTVSNPGGTLPTSATANAAAISILPGFPTDSAKKSGGDFTPFGLFFANSTTLYVADEGSGNATDQTLHAGLEKWSEINGVWTLDYTLQSNLIGTSYTISGINSGVAGTWPTVTTAGLRDITGKVNADGTVTIWGVTSTSSASTDNGADPNEIVQITDLIGDTTLPANEAFSVLDGPQYGVRYGGVAFAEMSAVPELSTWAMMVVGFAGMGFVAYRKMNKSTTLVLAA